VSASDLGEAAFGVNSNLGPYPITIG